MPPLYDLASVFAAQIQTGEHESSRVYEAVIGIVTDNKDPSKLGRVKLKIPTLSDIDATWWAPIVMVGAGKNRGWFFIPELNDEVLVMFEHGDMNRPLVIGSLWNGKDKPPSANPDGKNHRRVIKSRAGSKITFDDSDSPQIVIEDGGGKGRITIDSKTNKITIEALTGDVCLQSPAGDMTIAAKSLELKATENIEINAGDAMAWRTDATATIHGGANVELSGSTVNFSRNSAAPAAPTTGQEPSGSSATPPDPKG